MSTKLSEFFLNQKERVFLPVGIYGGLVDSENTVAQTVTSADIQYEVSLQMHEAFDTPVMLTGMDLSVEAEAFGCVIRFSDDEVPTVIGRKVTTSEEILNLKIPQIGDARMGVYLGAAERLSQVGKKKGVPVLGGMIGPFSLAGRIFGVSEAMELSLTNPDDLISLLEKVTLFLIQYANAFKEAGADGVIIAEPAAGLLSPRGLGKFSSPYVRKIIEATQNEGFTIVLHNCGAKIVHLSKILEAGAEIYNFGEPMDMASALSQVPNNIILGGNLDPSSVFASGDVGHVIAKTKDLLATTDQYPNFFVSSGCEIPPNAKSEHIRACAQIVKSNFP